MTGKYNSRNYVAFETLDPKQKTFGHLMQEAGYAAAVAGKWQLSGNNAHRGTLPENAGFDACSVTDHPFPTERWLKGGGHHAHDLVWTEPRRAGPSVSATAFLVEYAGEQLFRCDLDELGELHAHTVSLVDWVLVAVNDSALDQRRLRKAVYAR